MTEYHHGAKRILKGSAEEIFVIRLFLQTIMLKGKVCVVRPVVTGYFFFLLLFAETLYVHFVPASDHLGIACLFHD